MSVTFYDYFLKFDSLEQANTLLATAGMHSLQEVDPESEPEYLPHMEVSMYHVGHMYEGGEWDSEGNEITPPTAIPGWHVNIRLREELTPEQSTILADAIINPATPKVIFG